MWAAQSFLEGDDLSHFEHSGFGLDIHLFGEEEISALGPKHRNSQGVFFVKYISIINSFEIEHRVYFGQDFLRQARC